MAMMKCKECSSDVSTKATSCPKCGAPIKARSGCLGKAIAGVFVVFVVLTVVAVISPPNEQTSRTAASPEDPASREKSVRSQTLVLGIKKSLRNPDSFEAESVLVTDAGAVCAVYRAENGFGGINVEKAVMNAAQTRMLGSSEAGFAELWNRECAGQTGLETKYLYNHR